MADNSSHSEQLIYEDRERDSDNDGSDNNGSEASDDNATAAKRPRVATVERSRVTTILPTDVSDALVLLRITKEKKFLAAADGRSKHGALRIWEDISAELTRTFGNRRDVSPAVLTARALGKRWSYVEKVFKVSSFLVTFETHVMSVCVSHILAGLPRIAEAKWRCSPPATCLHPVKGCV